MTPISSLLNIQSSNVVAERLLILIVTEQNQFPMTSSHESRPLKSKTLLVLQPGQRYRVEIVICATTQRFTYQRDTGG